ncbi:MAG: hypothetical protein AB7W59_13575 [Acidimicrobiia bacterium]
MKGTYKLREAAAELGLTVPETLHLCFGGQLELTREGPHDALRISAESLQRYVAEAGPKRRRRRKN